MNRASIGRWIQDNALWVVGGGLALASSGLDGRYMSSWMPPGWAWLGLVLNTVSDVAGSVLMYKFGRLQQDRLKKKRRLALLLLPAEVTMVAYSWFFSWRQLRLVLPQVEPQDWVWVSWIAAGFIPLLLAFIGYAQALLAGRFEAPPVAEAQVQVPKAEPELPKVAEKPMAKIGDWRKLLPELANNGRLSAADVAEIVEAAGFALPSARTLASWAQLAREDHADAE